MMRGAVNEKTAEKAAMYALGMLSRSESHNVERPLDDEPGGYAEEIAAFEAVVAVLALSAPERMPPAEARSRLLDRIAN
jgi:anti-sigma-K factor RskA